MADREQLKKDMKDKKQIDEAYSEGSLETTLAAHKAQEEGSNEILKLEEVKEDLRKSLLGKETRLVPAVDQNGDVIEGEYRKVEIETSEKQLINKKGFDVVWSIVNSYLNKNVLSAYLPRETVEKIMKGLVKQLSAQIAFHRFEYGISTWEDASTVVDIVRTTALANLSKSQGGRALESKEKTLVEKIVNSGDDDEDDSFGPSIDF